jgi:peptide/nickel transport system permease protein
MAAALARLVRREPLGAAGALVVLVMVAVALFAPGLAPHGPKETGFAPYTAPWGPTRWGATC